ncbi:MAG: S8 family peptidase [Methanosarcinales archaeon]|nr:S8 family peptidase [Methanosarcinales archaeon]
MSPSIEAKPVTIGFNENIDIAIIDEYNITNYTQHQLINAISADITESTLHKMKTNRKIRYIEDDIYVHITKKAQLPLQQIDWGVYKVNAPAIWNNTTGSGVKIAIIDTGISNKHPDLTVSGGINLVGTSTSKKWNDDNGHGTHVAGIIGARNNSIGVLGVAPGAELYAVKVLDQFGGGSISDVVEGIEWAVQNDMDIISMSLGTTEYSQALNDSSTSAYHAGILLVASAGNNGDGNPNTNDVMYPARFESVIAISAIDQNNMAVSWSADGSEVELAAPGVGIYSTWLDGGYRSMSGTSIAAPFVSGVAALMLQNNGGASPDEVRAAMADGAVDLGVPGRDNVYGFIRDRLRDFIP